MINSPVITQDKQCICLFVPLIKELTCTSHRNMVKFTGIHPRRRKLIMTDTCVISVQNELECIRHCICTFPHEKHLSLHFIYNMVTQRLNHKHFCASVSGNFTKKGAAADSQFKIIAQKEKRKLLQMNTCSTLLHCRPVGRIQDIFCFSFK